MTEYFYRPPSTIKQAIENQANDISPGNFICDSCKNHTGGCQCSKGVFIAFEGGDMRSCIWHERGIKCIHCGKMT